MLINQPIIRLSAQAKKDWEKRLRDDCIRDGRASRRAHIPYSACPPFRDNDMAIHWRNGWRWEDEEIKARRASALTAGERKENV